MEHPTEWAEHLAKSYLAVALPQRWSHVRAVAAAAERLRPIMATRADADVLVTAAWLHDLGYAAPLRDSGWHPLDGARFLARVGTGPRLCGLVANHSGARYEAAVRGLATALAEFPDEHSPVRDGLWFCDMTTGPTGGPVSFPLRLREVVRRYGRQHPTARGLHAAAEEIRSVIDAVERTIQAHAGQATMRA